jgi:heme exporter protein CcmD
MDLKEFFAMGGYAGFVWSAYGLTALVLIANWWGARRTEAAERVDALRRIEILRENQR